MIVLMHAIYTYVFLFFILNQDITRSQGGYLVGYLSNKTF